MVLSHGAEPGAVDQSCAGQLPPAATARRRGYRAGRGPAAQRWPGAPLQLPARSGPAGGGARPDQESEALLAEAVCVELRCRSGDAVPSAERLGVDAELWVEPADWQAALDAIRAASPTLHERAKPPAPRVPSG